MYQADYEKVILAQQTPYLQWMKEHSTENEVREEAGERFLTLPFSSCEDKIDQYPIENTDKEWVLFVNKRGMASTRIYTELVQYIEKNPDADLIYVDEDYLGTLQEIYHIQPRQDEVHLFLGRPWFKPDFSPDTLQSFFYFGNCFAVKRKVLLQWKSICYDKESSIYQVIYRGMLQEKNRWRACFHHLPQVLYTNGYFKDEELLPGMGTFQTTWKEKPWISIVIPTKDHIELLEACLESIIKKSSYEHYEIILVDNGSTKENQLWITEKIKEYHTTSIQYLYQEEAFNFSKMCNRGAKNAKGELLLFLNNDMEILEEDWLEKLASKSMEPHVGAVGAKLVFPKEKDSNCYKIQHVGVANMKIGPMHKLCGVSDEGNLYHGKNRVAHNVLIVTGACLMVRSEVFWTVGGFDEDFPVSYNDVEFCIRLWEKGFYNVQRSDCKLIHHESVSRGADVSEEKQNRLFEDLERLYEKHPAYRGKDPFYHEALVQTKRDVDFVCEYQYPFEKLQKVETIKKLPVVVQNKILKRVLGQHLLQLQIEAVGRESQGVYRVDGWSVWHKHDNRLQQKWLILKNLETGQCFQIAAYPKLREDVAQVFENPTMRLSGLQVMFQANDLPKGNYQIGMLLLEQAGLFTRKKLCFSTQTLVR